MCPDFPKPPGVGATATEVWSYATRGLTGDAANAIRDAILSDATKIPGANIDAAISAVKAQTDLLPSDPADESLLEAAIATRAPAGEYNTEMAHLDVDVSTRSTLAQADILSDATPIAGARVAATPAYETPVETSIVMDGTEKILVEKTDSKMGLLEGYVDLAPMQAGDTIVIRQHMIVKAAGSYVKYAEESYSDVQSIPLLHVVTKTAKTSIKVTAQQTAGTNRTLDVQFFRRKEA